MMFSVPALFILSTQEQYGTLGLTDFNALFMVLGCIVGGILGVAFIIPLRKQMIDYNRLAYPGGIATGDDSQIARRRHAQGGLSCSWPPAVSAIVQA